MADTTYKVETVFGAVDETSKVSKEIKKSLDDVARSSQNLQTILKATYATILGSRVYSAAKSNFIDYNSQIEQHKVKLAGMLTMYTGANIDKTFDRAGVSVARFEQLAKSSSLTTKDLVDTASGLTRPLLQAGLSMTQIEKVTFGVANAAKAFGIEGGIVAMDIEQALTVGVSQRDRFTRNILAQKGVNLTQSKFNALTVDKRVEALQKALTSNAIVGMAKKQGENTFGGVMSTLEDNFQILASKIGLPLFQLITKEVSSWNGWLEKNSRKISEIGKEVGSTLVSGFKVLKDVFGWLYDHSDKLLMIAKAYGAIKIGQSIAGGAASSLGGAAGGVGGLLKWLNPGGKLTEGFNDKGEYEYSRSKAGRGQQGVGGFKGILENAQLLGAAASVGAVIGTYLKNQYALNEVISQSKTVNGEVLDVTNQTTREYAYLIESMTSMDKAIEAATDKLHGLAGAAGTQRAANLEGMSDIYGRQANLIQDLMRNGKGFAGDAPGLQNFQAIRDSKLFDQSDIGQILQNPQKMQSMFDTMSRTAKDRERAAVETADTAWSNIPAELKATLDEQKVMNSLVAKALEVMPGGGADGLKSGAYTQAIILDKKEIASALKNAAEDKDLKGAKVNQHVQITIQQVMAKDPNRWLADMDDMVNKRTRSMTRSKKGWRGSAQ